MEELSEAEVTVRKLAMCAVQNLKPRDLHSAIIVKQSPSAGSYSAFIVPECTLIEESSVFKRASKKGYVLVFVHQCPSKMSALLVPRTYISV